MHVHITYTGGTIGMVDSPHGLVPGADLEGWLGSLLEGTPLARSVSVTSLDPLIDSSNATPLSWQAVVDDLRAQAVDNPEAAFVVLRSFGVGNVPSQEPGLTDVVERVIDAGTAVIVTSQCHESEVLLGHYEAGDALARSGAVGSRDMTLEAAYAKVQFLLSQGLTGDDLAGWMGRSIAGELSQ